MRVNVGRSPEARGQRDAELGYPIEKVTKRAEAYTPGVAERYVNAYNARVEELLKLEPVLEEHCRIKNAQVPPEFSELP